MTSFHDYTSYWALPRYAAPQPTAQDAHDPVPTDVDGVTSPSEFIVALAAVASASVLGPVLIALAPATVLLPIGVVLVSGLGATGMLALRRRIRTWVGMRGASDARRPVRPME